MIDFFIFLCFDHTAPAGSLQAGSCADEKSGFAFCRTRLLQ